MHSHCQTLHDESTVHLCDISYIILSCILESTFSFSQQERLREVSLEFVKLSYLPMLLQLEINVLTKMDLEFLCILSFVGIATSETVTSSG